METWSKGLMALIVGAALGSEGYLIWHFLYPYCFFLKIREERNQRDRCSNADCTVIMYLWMCRYRGWNRVSNEMSYEDSSTS